MEKIGLYDLRRVSAYGFAIENIRFVLMEIQQLHANGGRDTKVSRAKDIEMLIDLIIREPQPLLEYKITGGLKMIELKGDKKHQRYEWGDQYLWDCKPSPFLKDNLKFSTMDLQKFNKAADLQDKIFDLKNSLDVWNNNDYGKAFKLVGNDIKDAVCKLFNDKVNEKINQLQKEFKEL